MQRTAKTYLPNPGELPWPPGVSPASMGLEPNARRFRMGGCIVIVGSTPAAGYYLSISCAHRYPTWDEVAHARYALIPDHVTMAMILPPSGEYVNVHPHCLHLWQVAGETGRREGEVSYGN